MGKKDNRRTRKMLKKRAQAKKKARIKAKISGGTTKKVAAKK